MAEGGGMSGEQFGDVLGSIFGDDARIVGRCMAGDRAAMRLAIDRCKADGSPIPNWLWRALDGACKKAEAR